MGQIYGNWGGRNWSGGKNVPEGGSIDWRVGGIDNLDRSFKDHDKGYDAAEKERRAGLISRAEEERRKIDADRKLVDAMRKLDPTNRQDVTDRHGRAVRSGAIIYFWSKVNSYDREHSGPSTEERPGGVVDGIADPSAWADPLVLDLDGNGIEWVTLAQSRAFFDPTSKVCPRLGPRNGGNAGVYPAVGGMWC